MKVNVNRGKEKGGTSSIPNSQKPNFKNNKLNDRNVSRKIKDSSTSRAKNLPYRRSP